MNNEKTIKLTNPVNFNDKVYDVEDRGQFIKEH